MITSHQTGSFSTHEGVLLLKVDMLGGGRVLKLMDTPSRPTVGLCAQLQKIAHLLGRNVPHQVQDLGDVGFHKIVALLLEVLRQDGTDVLQELLNIFLEDRRENHSQ